ncbi:MAG: Holliday junction branch migration protein RuvA, partial [Alphaproteobacteria bacterium]|nr:Holliday junction branch migration protein RuvA [Alphaproteobacteria bacterium]
TQVLEDAINLYGFLSTAERDWFRLLTGVQGVGAKSALAILGVLPPERLTHALAAQDKSALTQADGVGPKLALRIVTELKDKVGNVIGFPEAPALASAVGASSAAQDATSALINLGYRRIDAFAAVATASQKLGADAKIDTLIRTALAELSRKDGTA